MNIFFHQARMVQPVNGNTIADLNDVVICVSESLEPDANLDSARRLEQEFPNARRLVRKDSALVRGQIVSPKMTGMLGEIQKHTPGGFLFEVPRQNEFLVWVMNGCNRNTGISTFVFFSEARAKARAAAWVRYDAEHWNALDEWVYDGGDYYAYGDGNWVSVDKHEVKP